MNEISKREKSKQLLTQSREAYRNLDIPGAFRLVLDSIETDPAHFKAYFTLKNVMSTVAFSRPELFDYERIVKLFRKSLEIDPQVPILWNQLGRLHKLHFKYEEAEEALFKGVMFGNDKSHWFNQMYNIFELGYVYKNLGQMDVFNRVVFATPWNVNIHRKIRRVALPVEILEKRLAVIDFKIPPIKFIRKLEEIPGRYHFLSLGDKVPNKDKLLRLLAALDKKGVLFSLFHIPPLVLFAGLDPQQKKITRYIPSTSLECPAAIMTEPGYRLKICPVLMEKVSSIVKHVEKPWQVAVEKYPFCRCH